MTAWLQGWGRDPADRPDTAMTWMRQPPTGHQNMAGMTGMAGAPVTPETMPGMASADELRALADSTGRDTDARFLRLMKAHHEGGVTMAQDAAVNAKEAKVRDLAARIAKYQHTEINEMTQAQQRLNL